MNEKQQMYSPREEAKWSKIFGTEPYRKFERSNVPLTPEDSEIEEASIKKYHLRKNKMIKEYLNNPEYAGETRNVVNTDEARKLFRDVGYKGYNSAAVHGASSKLKDDILEHLLKTAPKTKRDAVAYIGGAGSGKSSTIETMIPGVKGKAAVVLDGVMASLGSANKFIEKAYKAGKKPVFPYVYRDPLESFKGTIERAVRNKKEGGRVVNVNEVLKGHKGAYETAKHLTEHGHKVYLIDNSGDRKAVWMTPEKFNSIKFTDDLKDKMVEHAKQEYKNGRITAEQLHAIIS